MIRKLACTMLFLAATLATVIGQPPPLPGCDGTSPKQLKCNYFVDPYYFESTDCGAQGEYVGVAWCKQAVAFNIDSFACTPPATQGDPPKWVTYCIDDESLLVECTRTQACHPQQYESEIFGTVTRCLNKGDPAILKRYKKKSTPCNAADPTPGSG